MKTNVQAVVIGGGVVGCSVLYHLTKLGWKEATRPKPRVSTPAAAGPVERAKSLGDQEQSGQDELVSDISFDEDEVVDTELTGDVGKDVPEGEEMDDDADDDLLGKPEELTGEEDDFRS